MTNRERYRLLRFLQDAAGSPAAEDLMLQIKRELRRPNRRPGSNPWTEVHADCDSRLLKRFYPGPMSDTTWDRLVEEETIEYRPTYYDCTGQPFTSWIDRYRTSTGYWVYHRISYDV